MKRHRLPEVWPRPGARSRQFADVSIDGAWPAPGAASEAKPIDLEKGARHLAGGTGGSGKSAVAAKICMPPP
jgi:hypothetical protein